MARAITLLDLLGELAPALPVTCYLPDDQDLREA